MNDSDFISAAREVLKCEANSILAAVDRLDANFARAVGEILRTRASCSSAAWASRGS